MEYSIGSDTQPGGHEEDVIVKEEELKPLKRIPWTLVPPHPSISAFTSTGIPWEPAGHDGRDAGR